MKKLILGIALLSSSLSFSQGIPINLFADPTDISGTTYNYLETTGDSAIHMVDFLVENTTQIAQPWMITRRIMEEPVDWDNSFCWGIIGVGGGFCYSSQAEFSSSSIQSVQPGQIGILSAYLDLSPSSGTARYRYYISSNGVNYLDSIDILVNSSLGINDVSPTLNVSIAPNPASEKITISAHGVDEASVKIIDVLGNQIMTRSINESTTIDVSEFRNGIYFILVESQGVKTVNRKIIIHH